MKHLLLAFTIALIPIGLMANQRSKADMDAIATGILGGSTTETEENGLTIMPTVGIVATASELLGEIYSPEPFYVYARIDRPYGYVIVYSDDHLPEVLAFSEDEPFYKEDLPDALIYILRKKAKTAQLVSEGKTVRKVRPRKTSYSQVEPLLGDIAFGQRAPFNNLCPMSGSQRTITGCVSTAMSQVMAYYQYPANMQGEYISYTTTGGIPVTWDCATTVFDWDNILSQYPVLVEDFTGPLMFDTSSPLILMGMSLYPSYPEYLSVINLANVALPTQNLTSCILQLLLADNEGNILRPVGTTKEFASITSGQVWNFAGISHTVPSDIPDGTYRLYLGVQHDGGAIWKVIPEGAELAFGTSTSEYYLEVEKTGKYYTLLGETFPCGYSPDNATAVATLHAATGASVHMNYGTGSSNASTQDAAIALVNNMDYDDALNILLPNFFTDEGWTQTVTDELNASRPVLCSGTTSSNQGHAFIIDGCKYSGDNLLFHVNWGWVGSSNGYYSLDNLTPEEAGDGGIEENYSYSLSLVTHIQPNNMTDDGFTFGVESIALGSSSVNAGTSLSISLTKLTNCSPATFNGDINTYLCDADGVEYSLGKFMTVSDLPLQWYYTSASNSLNVPETIPEGTYSLILKVKSESGVENKVISSEYPQVSVVNPALGIVSEDASSITASGNYAKVIVNRTIFKDQWSTIVLPFSMSESQVIATFGSDVKIVEFTGSDVNKSGSDITGIQLNFTNKASKSIEANHPYLIRTSSDITTFNVSDATVEAAINPEIVIDGDHFIGNYEAGTLLDEDCIFLADNKFFYSVGLTTIKSLRAYFDLANVLTDKSVSSEVKFVINNEVTPIEEIDSDVVRSAYYSIQGIKSNHPTNGINIHNGKKVLMR